jgi:hypothetical protein
MAGGKIYFAILAHINEEALSSQIRNIRHFNPGAGIIVYNGGQNPDFAQSLDVLLYPGSHPIPYGNLTPYFWEIMKWLENQQVDYEYLINLDHDVLFVQHGFQSYLAKVMKHYDVMGWHMVTSFSPADASLSCCCDMWKEWGLWGPFFRTEYFIRFLNSTQVYRRSIVRKMLQAVDHQAVERMIRSSKVFALEEMFFVTLALSLGARIREYPREENWRSVSRFGHEQISKDEVRLIMRHPYYYWIHPVKESWLIRMNQWLLGLEDWDAPEPDAGTQAISSPTAAPAPLLPIPAPAHRRKRNKTAHTRKMATKPAKRPGKLPKSHISPKPRKPKPTNTKPWSAKAVRPGKKRLSG